MVLKKVQAWQKLSTDAAAYPDCNFMTWNVPAEEKCPQCGCTLFQKGRQSPARWFAKSRAAAMNVPSGEEVRGEWTDR